MAPCAVDVPDRQRGFSCHRQQPRPTEGVPAGVVQRLRRGAGAALLQGFVQGRRRGLGTPAKEVERRISRLDRPAQILHLAKGVFRGGDVTSPETEHAELVEPERDVREIPGLELVAGTRRFDLCFGPVTPLLQDLGSVHAAVARELARSHSRPAPHLFDPFRGAAIVAEEGTGADGPAVARRRRPRPEEPADRARHGLVEQRETFVHPPQVDASSALLERTQRLDISIAERTPDLDGALCILQRRLAIAQHLARDDALDPRQPTLLDAFRQISQERGRILEPSARHGHRLPTGVVERQVERDERSAADVTLLDEPGVGALPGSDALVQMAHPERRLAEPFDVARLQRPRVGLSQQRERQRPVGAVDRRRSSVRSARSRHEITLVSTTCPCRRGHSSGIDGDAPVLARHEIPCRHPSTPSGSCTPT